MRRAFAWAEAERFEAGVLLTDKPDLYRGYGFETVPQHAFRGRIDMWSGPLQARPLSLDRDEDLALTMRLLAERDDLSNVFSARRQTKTFLLNACLDPGIRLCHLPDLDAVIAWRMEGGRLQVLDVVACEMPRLADIVSALGSEAGFVEVLFPPDRLGWDGEPFAYRGSCELMIRQANTRAVPPAPFMLSPLAEF